MAIHCVNIGHTLKKHCLILGDRLGPISSISAPLTSRSQSRQIVSSVSQVTMAAAFLIKLSSDIEQSLSLNCNFLAFYGKTF